MDKNVDYIIGFDFGHGETSVAKVDVKAIDVNSANIDAEDIRIVGNGREMKIPSMVGYDVDNNVQLDFDAYQFRFLKIGAYFKAPMISSSDFPAITEENKKYFKDFAVSVFNQLHKHPSNQDLKGKNVLYFVACPSGWNKEQQEAYLDFFNNYCGMPVTGIIEESRAAYVVARRKLHDRDPRLSAFGKKIAVLDLGSSTLDITMHSDKAYTDGYEIGASQIEDALLHYFLDTNKDFKQKYHQYEELEETCRNQILFLLRCAKEEYYNKVSKGGSGEILLKCQIDWEELSSDEIQGISNLKLKGTEIESILDSHGSGDIRYKEKLRESINSFIKTYGKVDAVVLTGGASQMSFYKDIVLESYELSEDYCIVDKSPSYSISQGTAIMGYIDTKSPTKPDNGDPAYLTDLLKRIPDIIKNSIITGCSNVYFGKLSQSIEEWKNGSEPKTIRRLHDQLTSDLNTMLEQYDETNHAINSYVVETVTTEVNKSLSDIMKLYFGFDVQLGNISLKNEYNVAQSKEECDFLIQSIYKTYRRIIKESSLFARYSEPKDLDKDRSGDTKMLNLIADGIKDYVSRWFNGYTIDDEFDDIINDSLIRVKEYYYSCIRHIICQI